MKRLSSALIKSTLVHLFLVLLVVALVSFRPNWIDQKLRLGTLRNDAAVDVVWSAPSPSTPSDSAKGSSILRKKSSRSDSAGGTPLTKPAGSLVVPHGAPEYPLISRRSGEQGKVTVGFILAPDGSAKEIAVIESSGHTRLDEAAVDFMKTTRLTPSGRISAHEPLRLEFIFSLKN